MTIYISGKITGDPNYKEKFEQVENTLEELNWVSRIVNPAKLDLIDGGTWEDYMKRDIPLLTICDAIFMMKGWRRSKGARLERYIAKKLGLLIIYER